MACQETSPSHPGFGPGVLLKQEVKFSDGMGRCGRGASYIRPRRINAGGNGVRRGANHSDRVRFWSPAERSLYDLLNVDESLHGLDKLVERSGLTASPEVLAALFDLELKTVVRQLPGNANS